MKYWVAIFNGRLKPALTRAARVAFVAAWISLTIFAVAEATAKSADTNTEFNINVNLCEHAVDDPQVRIVACSFVLNSGNIPEKEIPRVYYYRANGFTKAGQLDQALQDLNRLINLDPTRAEAFYNRGRIYYFKHQYGRAIQNFDRAIAIFFFARPDISKPRDTPCFKRKITTGHIFVRFDVSKPWAGTP